ncbi:glutamate receptor-like [Palaemon carinicauda]|uniref:glutamate receptor-like n=1 Tax=Palaemon carinicauda TaxID=392227 RepID=UPI0035B5E501
MINFSANTPERYRDFDLTVAYHFEGFGLVLEVPRPLPRWQNLLLPFTSLVWIIVVVSFIVTSAVYYLLYYQFDKSLVENIFLITQDLMNDTSGDAPTPWKIRNFLLMWWIFSWIIQLCWICNLIAVLTIPIFPKKIQTKEELAKSKYRLCMLDYGEFVPEALRTSTESTLATLGSKLDLVPLRMDWKEFGHEGCVELVVAGTHAQTETYSYIKMVYVRLGHAARTYMLRDELYPSYLSFRLRKHTAWKHKFDYGIQRLYETGLVQLWLRRAMDEFAGKSAQETSSEGQAPLTLEHLQGSFLILSVGLFVSLLIMAGEVLSSPRK